MHKAEFMRELGWRLAALPMPELKKSLEYYSEIIDDRVEDGMSEEEAVRALGDMDEIAREALRDFVPGQPQADPEPPVRPEHPQREQAEKEAPSRKKRRFWKPLLIALGSPFWIPLLMAGICIVLALYVCLWAAALSLFVCGWAAVLSFAAVDIACLAGGVMGVVTACLTFPEWFLTGLFVFGCALAVFGLGLFFLPLTCRFFRIGWKAGGWVLRGAWKLSALPFRRRRRSKGGEAR